jgi:hypothetical protein
MKAERNAKQDVQCEAIWSSHAGSRRPARTWLELTCRSATCGQPTRSPGDSSRWPSASVASTTGRSGRTTREQGLSRDVPLRRVHRRSVQQKTQLVGSVQLSSMSSNVQVIEPLYPSIRDGGQHPLSNCPFPVRGHESRLSIMTVELEQFCPRTPPKQNRIRNALQTTFSDKNRMRSSAPERVRAGQPVRAVPDGIANPVERHSSQ